MVFPGGGGGLNIYIYISVASASLCFRPLSAPENTSATFSMFVRIKDSVQWCDWPVLPDGEL